jgi:hypothetical protein
VAAKVQAKVSLRNHASSRSENNIYYRNHVPWIIIGICYALCMSLLLTIRYHLSSENKRRDNEPVDDTYDDVYIEKLGKDGQKERIKVDKVGFEDRAESQEVLTQDFFQEFLDLTDIQNRDFRYVL